MPEYKEFLSLLNIKYFFSLTVLLFLSGNLFADNPPTDNEIKSKAIENQLWKKSEWINLIHYKSSGNGYLSQVDDDRFFYAKNGKEDPQAELISTLDQLFKVTENSNQQTQCRFIARSQWLIEQLDIDKKLLPEALCNEYQEWYEKARGDSVTLVFPAYHLNSPSSMFGHTLLRLDKSEISQSDWISYAVNFGADTSSNDGSIVYAYRGVVGGYPGLFITEPYFKKIQEYNKIEHRDIWEYKLNLSAEETERMIKHLWELKTINFDYFFFDENCSYRLLELLEVARPGIELTDKFTFTAIPVDTVKAINEAGLIQEIKFRPAQVTELQYTLNQLSEQQQNIVLQLSNDYSVSQSPLFSSLTTVEKKRIVALAYKYLRYQNAKETRKPEIVKRGFQLLQLLNSYPADINIDVEVPAPLPPNSGHDSRRISIGYGKRLDNQYIDIEYKMSFHELEDNRNGFLEGAQINLGRFKFRAEENEGLRLYKFDVVDIFSLTPRNKFISPLSWKIITGFERQLSHNEDDLVFQVTGGAGGSWEIVKSHLFYSLATLRLEMNKNMDNNIEPAIGFDSGFISHFSQQTVHFKLSGEQFNDDLYRLRAQYTHNYVISTNQSLRLLIKKQWQENDTEFTDVSLSYQAYF